MHSKRSDSESVIRERVRALASQLRHDERHRGATLDNYICRSDEQRKVLETMRKVASRIDEMIDDGWNVILYGSAGTGKDHLMVSLLKLAAGRGASCVMMNGQRWMSNLRDNITKGAEEGRELRAYQTCDVLGISDVVPMRREMSGYNVDMLYLLLNERWERRMATIITLNAKSEAEISRRIGGPVYDRIRQGAIILEMRWDSERRPLVL